MLAQRLVRLLCPHCKSDDGVLSDEVWASLTPGTPLPKPERVYRPVGCPECRQTGYRGRSGLYELLTVTPAFSRLIGARTDNHQLMRQGLADGMTPLRVAGAHKVAEGLTTADEVLKVTAAMNAPAG